VVLDDGRIVESGSHRQLLESNGHYAALYNMNFGETT
jgi:subfamily B ATP-binding cassette protein MsbA